MSAAQVPPTVHRRAVRIACLDSRDRLLLMNWRDPEDGELLWEPPGGGVEPGESDLQAARREWWEETALPDVLPSDETAVRLVVVPRDELWAGRRVVFDEPVYLARLEGEGLPLLRDNLMPDEQVNLVQARWLTRTEVERLPERVTPDVVAVLRALGAGGDWT